MLRSNAKRAIMADINADVAERFAAFADSFAASTNGFIRRCSKICIATHFLSDSSLSVRKTNKLAESILLYLSYSSFFMLFYFSDNDLIMGANLYDINKRYNVLNI